MKRSESGLKIRRNWWARQDSNLGPIHYECTALTRKPQFIYKVSSRISQKQPWTESSESPKNVIIIA